MTMSIDDLIIEGLTRLGETTDTTDGNLRISNGEGQIRVAGQWRIIAPVPLSLSSTTQVTTTSDTFAIVSGMSTTPAAGEYRVDFTASWGLSNKNTICNVGLWIDETETAKCRRSVENETGKDVQGSVAFSTIITVNGTQQVSVRFNETAGATFSIYEREMLLTPLTRPT